uniref:Matrix protein n=1 Tax=Black currant nucleorhabdovirus 1 TaxID=2079521 RepID=A0A8S3X342_9RHAB|nr:matrix protein [Black currant nucleorhabdovirus 1]CAG4997680.1 matrix protein [Black currant nucleorhabdovirus 1]
MSFVVVPGSFSIKGRVSLAFSKQKSDFSSSKMWDTVKKLTALYPEKIKMTYAVSRDDKAMSSAVPAEETSYDVMNDIIGGCILTNKIFLSYGKSTDLLIGDCHKYTIPFGSSSDDTGHTTIFFPLPYPMDGCYKISAGFKGKFGSRSAKEPYILTADLEIYISSLSQEKYDQGVSEGYKVYPLMKYHPEHFPNSDTSDSEHTSDQSEAEELETSQMSASKKRKSPSPRGKKMRKIVSYIRSKAAVPSAPPLADIHNRNQHEIQHEMEVGQPSEQGK